MTVYYPKRTDGVIAHPFDTQEDVRRIAQLVKAPVHHVIDHLGQEFLSIEGYPDVAVWRGDYVVVDGSNRLIDVLSWSKFHGKYSEDGR